MYIRKNKKSKQEVSLEDTLNYDAEGNELKLSDVLGTGEDIVDKEFEHKISIRTNEFYDASKICEKFGKAQFFFIFLT